MFERLAARRLRRLPPFFENVGKRLTKAPKIYIRDTGLLHHLLNIASLKVLDAHPAHPFSHGDDHLRYPEVR